MPDGDRPFLMTWAGMSGWYDPSRTAVTDDRTRVRRIARAVASEPPVPRYGVGATRFSWLLRERARRIVQSLYG